MACIGILICQELLLCSNTDKYAMTTILFLMSS